MKVTPEQYQALLIEWAGQCAFCVTPIHADDLVFDHIIPLSKGGNHVPENLRPAHYACNLKNNK
ncbi:HNH endonuclease signature motif containing protein [Deinococcus radiopugnans]|uniref:HNH endonuclease n=1 Tax=Deinococcus radiopugnans TaxID=57497 RepID=UPI0014701492